MNSRVYSAEYSVLMSVCLLSLKRRFFFSLYINILKTLLHRLDHIKNSQTFLICVEWHRSRCMKSPKAEIEVTYVIHLHLGSEPGGNCRSDQSGLLITAVLDQVPFTEEIREGPKYTLSWLTLHHDNTLIRTSSWCYQLRAPSWWEGLPGPRSVVSCASF